MILIWFIYGLAFFVLGLGILIYPKKGSAFKLADHIWMIAAFGILHGLNEWLDMFIGIGEPFPADVLRVIRLVTLCASFLFLLHFGTRIIAETNKDYRLLRVLPPVLLTAWSVVFGLSSQRLLMGDIMARYLLCAPGAILVAVGLMMQIGELKETRLSGVVRSLRLAVITFLFYGLVAGVIVKKATFFPASHLNYDLVIAVFGIPVQIFRAFCAVVLAGSIIYVLSVFHWETQHLLRRSEERCGAIASSMPLFLFVLDRKGIVTFAQGNGFKKLNLNPIEIAGRAVSEVFNSLPQIWEDSRRAQAGEEFGTTFRAENFIFEAHYSPLRADDGEIIGSIGLALDVTERVKAQKQLDDYRHQVEKNARLAEIGTLSSVMVEQVEPPLAVACLRLQRLVAEVPEDKTHGGAVGGAVEGLKRGLADVSKAAEIVSGFRRTTQISPRAAAQPVDLYKIVKTMLDVFAQSTQRANLKIVLKGMDCFPSLPIAVRELEQVFFILVRNAIDAADIEKQQKLTISCQTDENQVELIFADTCGGVDAGRVENIFEPFLPTQQGTPASGLSLAVAKQIVTTYGGGIRAESVIGQGTTFYVTFAAEKVQ